VLHVFAYIPSRRSLTDTVHLPDAVQFLDVGRFLHTMRMHDIEFLPKILFLLNSLFLPNSLYLQEVALISHRISNTKSKYDRSASWQDTVRLSKRHIQKRQPRLPFVYLIT
jgi:hypothetical protein